MIKARSECEAYEVVHRIHFGPLSSEISSSKYSSLAFSNLIENNFAKNQLFAFFVNQNPSLHKFKSYFAKRLEQGRDYVPKIMK